MKNKLLKKMMVVSATVVMMLSSVLTVNAAEITMVNAAEEITTDSSGNVFYAGQDVNLGQHNMRQIGNELVAAGLNINCDGAQVDGSVFAAANKVKLNDAKLGGSAFIAGQMIDIAAEANNNMFIVGQQIDFADVTKAKAMYTAGQVVNVKGSYKYVNASADTLYFDAVVDGDVVLDAANVHIGPNASVTGEFKIKYTDGYEANDAASVVNAQVEKVEASGENKKTTGALVLAAILKRVLRTIKGLFVNTVIALIMAFLFRKNLKEAADACKANPGSYLGFGALAMFVAPIAFVILLCTVIGVKAAIIGAIFYGVAIALQGVFTFASFGRELFFGKAKKRLNPVLEIIISVLPYAIACQIPGINAIINIACGLYTFGYIASAVSKKIKENSTCDC